MLTPLLALPTLHSSNVFPTASHATSPTVHTACQPTNVHPVQLVMTFHLQTQTLVFQPALSATAYNAQKETPTHVLFANQDINHNPVEHPAKQFPFPAAAGAQTAVVFTIG